jgi:hypothetical protein
VATIFRDWSYRYQWLYDAISRLAALSVGGEAAPVFSLGEAPLPLGEGETLKAKAVPVERSAA